LWLYNQLKHALDIFMAIVDHANISTEEWESYLGEQFRAMRIRANLEQLDLAARAGISVGALKNLEGGKGSSLKTLIKVARGLGRTDWLEALAPKLTVSPMQMLKARAKDAPRQRVYRPRRPGKAV
jgi:transcriptional regulator with XRE-family HTH domain